MNTGPGISLGDVLTFRLNLPQPFSERRSSSHVPRRDQGAALVKAGNSDMSISGSLPLETPLPTGALAVPGGKPRQRTLGTVLAEAQMTESRNKT